MSLEAMNKELEMCRRKSFSVYIRRSEDWIEQDEKAKAQILEYFLSVSSETLLTDYKTHEIAILVCIEVWKEHQDEQRIR
jgi:hypothetical protein